MKTIQRIALGGLVTLAIAGRWSGSPVAQSAIDDPGDVFRAGNAAYESGDYFGAIEAYRRLTDAGVDDATLYYNLANAYYKNNGLGNAVLFYERSLRIQPRNEDAKENLYLVRSQLRDKQFVTGQNRLVKGFIWLHDHLTTREMLLLASLSYLVLSLLVIVFIFRETRLVRSFYARMSVLSIGRLIGLTRGQDILMAAGLAGFLFITASISSYRKVVSNRVEAVVLAVEIAVYSSPTEDATLQFKIHEGTMVSVGERRSDWVRIELPGGMSGWVSSQSIENV